MKILDKYLLKSFLITFTTVFVILFFIFVLQVVWLFISELAGKDLDILMIVKFLLFKMPSIIPLVLPLSVLLASIMTFGSLAENYEFAAIKSSGISLQRAMRSLTIFIAILSVVAFLFANNVIPYAEYKFINFRRNIAQVKPAMAIAEGQFSEIGNYNIKVEKKSGEKGEHLDGITIHRKSTMGSGANTVIKAKKGELVSSTDSNVLKLILKNGNYYEDITPKKFEDRNKLPFAKSEFKSYVINIDLSKLNNANIDEQKITNTNTMLTVGELKYTLDSLQTDYNKNLVSQNLNLNQRFAVGNSFSNGITTDTNILSRSNILENFSGFDKQQIIRAALGSIDATSYSLENSSFEMIEKKKNINSHWIALYDKFVIAYACLLMFFIGAPLGAIIRKGGLGLPIVFAILIFITFHFINTFGKKVAQQDGMAPFLGCWLSSFVLTPLAITLTKIATDDKGVSFNFSLGKLQPILNRFFNSNTEEEEISEPKIKLDEITMTEEDNPVKEEKDFSPAPNIDYAEIAEPHRKYTLFSSIALACYFLLMGLVFFAAQLESTLIKISCISFAAIFLFSILVAQKQLNTIYDKLGLKTDLHIIVIVLAGYPFYLLFYFYNRSFLKGILNRFNKI